MPHQPKENYTMQKSFLAVVVAGMLTLSACQTTPPAAAKSELSDEAKIALSWAEADVKDAAKAGGVWTTAQDALKAAKDAAAKGDSANTLKHAKTASAQAKLGQGQKKYPLVKIGD
jgi:hypothetical protein